MFSSVAKKTAGGWEGIRSPNESETVLLARLQTHSVMKLWQPVGVKVPSPLHRDVEVVIF
jgi:hypothetical protein